MNNTSFPSNLVLCCSMYISEKMVKSFIENIKIGELKLPSTTNIYENSTCAIFNGITFFVSLPGIFTLYKARQRDRAKGGGDAYISILTSVQSLSRVRLFATPWTAARQSSLFITSSQSLLKLLPIELVMLSNHLIL